VHEFLFAVSHNGHQSSAVQMMAVNYQHNHRKPISCEAVSQMLSNQLYMKRFFPFYAFNLCAGLDAEGKGAVYSYDAVGSFERCGFGCQGSGELSTSPVVLEPVATGRAKMCTPCC
jgi:20S proteasome subunit beta 6